MLTICGDSTGNSIAQRLVEKGYNVGNACVKNLKSEDYVGKLLPKVNPNQHVIVFAGQNDAVSSPTKLCISEFSDKLLADRQCTGVTLFMPFTYNDNGRKAHKSLLSSLQDYHTLKAKDKMQILTIDRIIDEAQWNGHGVYELPHSFFDKRNPKHFSKQTCEAIASYIAKEWKLIQGKDVVCADASVKYNDLVSPFTKAIDECDANEKEMEKSCETLQVDVESFENDLKKLDDQISVLNKRRGHVHTNVSNKKDEITKARFNIDECKKRKCEYEQKKEKKIKHLRDAIAAIC